MNFHYQEVLYAYIAFLLNSVQGFSSVFLLYFAQWVKQSREKKKKSKWYDLSYFGFKLVYIGLKW